MENFKNMIYGNIAEDLTPQLEADGFQAVGKKLLEAANINPLYALEERDSELFTESRNKLNSEAGLIIANHPGYFDTFTIFNALKRSDVKIVVSPSNYETYKPILGEDRLINASKDPASVLSFLRTIKEHIENGGLVMLYPSGGVDRANKENKSFEFQSGFSAILKRCLKPDNMVYTFHIDDGDVESILDEKIPRIPGAVSAIALDTDLNPNKLKETAIIHVDEKYTRAEEWQKIAESADKDNKNEALTHHFQEIFNM